MGNIALKFTCCSSLRCLETSKEQQSIPLEIVMEILSWLPVKYVLRMKCVCKQWYALTQDRHFIEKHMSRLVSVYDDNEEAGIEGCEILTIGSDNSWRTLNFPNLNDANKKREKIMVVSAGEAFHCIKIMKKLKWGKEKIVVPLAFMNSTSELMGDLVPLFARSGDLWFWEKFKKLMAYNIESGMIKYTIAVAEWSRIPKGAVYIGPSSLITLKGMQQVGK
uniref:F-box domain-containing protein n=1 Tax=Fagus sylvatica TaxID=28930 RepID=A0A2N9ITD9_FAGSY